VANRCSDVLLRLTEPPQAVPGQPAGQVFRRDGEFWTISNAGKQIRLRDMRGLHYLATLLREPGREFAATDLVKFSSGLPLTRPGEDPALSVVSGLGDAGEALDARARAAYRERLREIEAERAEAERHGDLGRLGRASEERERSGPRSRRSPSATPSSAPISRPRSAAGTCVPTCRIRGFPPTGRPDRPFSRPPTTKAQLCLPKAHLWGTVGAAG
jgi:hypothetical protein